MRLLRPAALASLLAAPSAAAELRVQVSDKFGKPVEDAVVFVTAVPGKEVEPPKEPVIMDQVNKEFVPRVLPVLAGTSVRFPNKDDIHHHIYSFSDAKKFELPLYKGKAAAPVKFDKTGAVKLGCNIHDWMSAVVVAVPTPHFAKTGKAGTAVLALPEAEELEVELFHERLRGDPKETRRKVKPGKTGSEAWKVSLKTDFRKKRPAVESY